jgi:hypothetical protein
VLPPAFGRPGRNKQSSVAPCSFPTRSGLRRTLCRSAGTLSFFSPPPGGKIRALAA